VKLEVSHKELRTVLEKAWETKLALFIWGAPGIGKSSSVRDFAMDLAKKLGREYKEWSHLTKEEKEAIKKNPKKYFLLYDIRLSQYDPSDLRGLPALNGQETVEWKIPEWVYIYSLKDIAGIIFFDEINLAPPSVQAGAYQIILDRCISDTKLSDNVLIISAGNRIQDMANVYDLPKPLQNRFIHCVLKIPTAEEWTEWAQEKGLDSRVITFLNARPTFIFKMSEKSGDEAFPTPRSNEFWARLIADVPSNDLKTLEMLTATAVGTGVALEFVSFIKLQRQIDFKAILENPEKVKEINELDMKYALVSLIIEHWKKSKHSIENFKKLFNVFRNFTEEEFQIITLRGIKQISPRIIMQAIEKLPEFRDWAKNIIKYLT